MKFKFFGLAILTLLFSTLILLTSCGSTSETTEVSDSANAMSIIREYARTNGMTKMPQIKDYQDAGVRGVESNKILIQINNVLKEDEIGTEEIQSPEDIQMLLYERDILERYNEEEDIEVSNSPTPIPITTSTPIVTPTPISTPKVISKPPIESDFKSEDHLFGVSLILKGEGNITVVIGESYDYSNTYRIKKGNDDYLIDEIGVEGETMDIDASNFLVNKDKVGTYVIYYRLLGKDKKELLKVWRLISVVDRNVEDTVSTPIVAPSSGSGSGYDYISKDGISINFYFQFPTNTVDLNSKSLNFDPKAFNAIKKYSSGVEIDITSEIKIKIIYEENDVLSYDKNKVGEHKIQYSFNGKEIVTYVFYIEGDQTLTPIPVPTPSSIPTFVSGDEVEHGKWVKPSKNICENNGGEYRDFNSNNNECIANWTNANTICMASGYELPSVNDLTKIISNCDKFYQSCYKEQGFSSSRYWSFSTGAGRKHEIAWLIDFHDGLNGWYAKTSIDSVMCINKNIDKSTQIPTPIVTLTPIPTPTPTSISILRNEVQYGKWIKPSKKSCESNGGKYIDQNGNSNECRASWKQATKICTTRGYQLPTRSSLKSVFTNCDKLYQTCFKDNGFSSTGYWSSNTWSTHAWVVDFQFGEESDGWYNKMNIESVRCIK